MRLFYYQRSDGQPNFGDDLNRWLWPKLCPHLFESAENTVAAAASDTVFVGTGTLLNSKLPERVQPAKKVIIFSTGAGYEQPLKSIPEHWDICCVRGPLSVQQLGLSGHQAIADGGLLIASVFPLDSGDSTDSRDSTDLSSQAIARSPKFRSSFMPHIHSADAAAAHWQQICQQADIHYIDPRWPVEDVLSAIANSQQVITEAMHGAIAADALRVPWIPMVTSARMNAFKWQDWCASMALPYRPYRLPSLTSYPRWGRGVRSGAIATQHWLNAALEDGIATIQYTVSAKDAVIVRRLKQIAAQPPYLSADAIFSNRLERLQDSFSHLSHWASR